jgi:tRNA (guanine-N7-)-methyltransferase
MAKKKLARFAEMEVLPNVFQPKHEEVFRTDYPLKGKWNEEVFHNDHPIILEIGCGKGEYTVELGKLYPEKNFIGLDIKGARMWKGAKTAVENGMNNVAFLRMYAEMLESVFAPGEIAELWITFPDPQMAKARKRLSGTRFLSLYRKILAPQAVIHLKTDSLFLYRYTSALIELNHLPVEVRTEDLYGCGWEDKILSIKTFYEKQWLSRGKQIKYLRFSLGEDIPLTEPDVEIEKDDYHSETRYMNSHLVHGIKQSGIIENGKEESIDGYERRYRQYGRRHVITRARIRIGRRNLPYFRQYIPGMHGERKGMLQRRFSVRSETYGSGTGIRTPYSGYPARI